MSRFHANTCYTEKVKTRNVTLALPEDVLRRLKLAAVRQDTSLSAMLTRVLESMADEEDGYAEARRGMIQDLKSGYDLGTHGRISWTRESLHER